MPALRHKGRPPQPFDVRASRAADSELYAKLVLRAKGATVGDVTLDMPVSVFQQPGVDVAITKIEPGYGLHTTDIIAPARLCCEFPDLFRAHC